MLRGEQPAAERWLFWARSCLAPPRAFPPCRRLTSQLPLRPHLQAGELPDDSKVVVDAPPGQLALTFAVTPDEEAAAARAAEAEVRC